MTLELLAPVFNDLQIVSAEVSLTEAYALYLYLGHIKYLLDSHLWFLYYTYYFFNRMYISDITKCQRLYMCLRCVVRLCNYNAFGNTSIAEITGTLHNTMTAVELFTTHKGLGSQSNY